MRLQRQVEIKHGVGSSGYRRRCASALAQLTLFRLVMASGVAWLLALVVVSVDRPSTPPKVEAALATVQVYAFEAFPQWALINHERACPSSIDELSAFTQKTSIDPWGTPLELICPHARAVYVRSAGPDRTFETADDISSHTER